MLPFLVMLKLGYRQQKILLLLLTGVALGLSNNPRRYFRIIRGFQKEWTKISRKQLNQSIKKLYASRLVNSKLNADGSVTLILTKKGEKHALRYQLNEMQIKAPKYWDGLWRMVSFDIPETKKHIRDSFRHYLKKLGFYEFQKSIFVHPYPCDDEIDFLIEFHKARRYVRCFKAQAIDNELHLKSIFRL